MSFHQLRNVKHLLGTGETLVFYHIRYLENVIKVQHEHMVYGKKNIESGKLLITNISDSCYVILCSKVVSPR